MLSRITRSLNIAVQVAVVGFEKSFRQGETMDAILGFTDALTGLPNRKAFERDAEQVGDRYSLVLIDIDDFKKVNDTRGHLFGDRVLRRLASILNQAVGGEGRAYRIAGDEFVLIVRRNMVSLICAAVRDRVRREDGFTVSQGVVHLDNGPVTDETISLADCAMYQSKVRGKNAITFAGPNLVTAN